VNGDASLAALAMKISEEAEATQHDAYPPDAVFIQRSTGRAIRVGDVLGSLEEQRRQIELEKAESLQPA